LETNLDGQLLKLIKLSISVLGLVLLAFLLTIPEIYLTASLFDAMNWPLFHSWGLAPGSILFIFPVYFILSLVGVVLLGRLVFTRFGLVKKKSGA
jgi:hypothetical protein